MRTLVIAMVALGAIAFPAAAQTPKPSVGSDQVYWVITFTVDQMDKFKPIVNKLVAATEKEPGTLAYEYTVGERPEDGRHLRAVYQRARRRRPRHGKFGPNFSKDLWRWPNPTRFVVYTEAPTDELKKTLADFHPIYMKPFDGFTR